MKMTTMMMKMMMLMIMTMATMMRRPATNLLKLLTHGSGVANVANSCT